MTVSFLFQTNLPSSASMQSENLISTKVLSAAKAFPKIAHVLGVRLLVDRSRIAFPEDFFSKLI